MAISSTRILSLKFLSISIAFLSVSMAMKFSIPLIIDFAIHDIPSIWSTILHLLKPPFLYLVVNGIIITIAAFSFLHQKSEEDDQSESLIESNSFPSDLEPEIVILESPAVYESEPRVLEVKSAPVNDEDEYMISRSTWTPRQIINSTEADKENNLPATEKPLVSSRFGHRKAVKLSPEGGKALGVAKPKRHETLENTWKVITDGRPVPLTRHLKKSDTWNDHSRQSSPQKMIKSETFKDRTNVDQNASPGSGKQRKEGSISQDELNRRVEAFIKKFNDEMRLQRQESLNQYKRIVNHAR